MTEAEALLWSEIRKKQLGGFRFRRQHPIGPYIADFACPLEKVVIEIDGWTHTSSTEVAHDLKRTTYLENQGWTTLRFWNDDILNSLNPSLSEIEQHLQGKT